MHVPRPGPKSASSQPHDSRASARALPSQGNDPGEEAQRYIAIPGASAHRLETLCIHLSVTVSFAM